MSIAIQSSHAAGVTSSSPKLHSDIVSDNHLVAGEAESLFSRDELREFAKDDSDAGRRIAKILAALFIYTLMAMGIATWWTFRTIGH